MPELKRADFLTRRSAAQVDRFGGQRLRCARCQPAVRRLWGL